MTRDEIMSVLLKHEAHLRAMGATGLYMFGSRARGDNTQDSDLDLFVDYLASGMVPSYFQLLELRLCFEEGLGIPVHLGTRASLDAAIRDVAEHDAVRVF